MENNSIIGNGYRGYWTIISIVRIYHLIGDGGTSTPLTLKYRINSTEEIRMKGRFIIWVFCLSSKRRDRPARKLYWNRDIIPDRAYQ